MSARTWKPIGEYRWVCAPWTVTRYELAGGPMFALWKGEEQQATGNGLQRRPWGAHGIGEES